MSSLPVLPCIDLSKRRELSNVSIIFHSPLTMFSGKSPNKSNIEEANRHLQLLYERVRELEEKLEIQASECSRREEQMVLALQRQLSDMTKRKDADISELKLSLGVTEQKRKISEEQVQILRDQLSENNVSQIQRDTEKWQQLVHEKDVIISRLQTRCQQLEEFQGRVITCRPSLEHLLMVMTFDEEETEIDSAAPDRPDLRDVESEAHYANPDLPQVPDSPPADQQEHHHGHVHKKKITKPPDSSALPGTNHIGQASPLSDTRNVPSVQSIRLVNFVNGDRKPLVNTSPLKAGTNPGINTVDDADDERSVTPTDLDDASPRYNDDSTHTKVELKRLGVVKEEIINGDPSDHPNLLRQDASGDATSDSSSIREMAHSFQRSTPHFSISEDEDDDRDVIMLRMRREKELYL